MSGLGPQHALRAAAPAKINLGLFVGPVRERDGRHELVTVMQSISLADELTLAAAAPGATADEVVCEGVPGPPAENLAAAALAAFRAQTGWDGPPQRLEIVKRIPVASGLAGGSADAAAALRLAGAVSGCARPEQLHAIAAGLGADVPAQLAPGRWLATGAGERLRELPAPRSGLGVLVLPLAAGLATADVYREADRLALSRPRSELAEREAGLAVSLEHGAQLPDARELLHNDLQRPAVSLCPAIAEALLQAGDVGADVALVSGSGPTVLGLFASSSERRIDGARRAGAAAAALAGRTDGALAATPVGADFGRPLPAGAAG